MAAAALVACDPYVQGNGVYREEDRSAGLPPFEGIHVEDRIRVEATETALAVSPVQTVVVVADANVVRWLKTEVREESIGGIPMAVLHLFVDAQDFVSENQPRAVIQATGLRYLRAREASRAEVSSAVAPHFAVDVAGGAEVSLRGPGGETLVATVDAGFVRAASYPVGEAEVALSGKATVELHAGIVSGTADAASRVDNFGGGPCDVQGTELLCCGLRESCR